MADHAQIINSVHPDIRDRWPEIERLCREHGVSRLFLFGSATGPRFRAAQSDFDFIVEFGDVPRHGLRDPYFKLHRSLETLLGRRVDLVEWDAVRNQRARSLIDRQRVELYAA